MALPYFVPVCLLGASRVATTNSKKSLLWSGYLAAATTNKQTNQNVPRLVRRSWSLMEKRDTNEDHDVAFQSHVWNLFCRSKLCVWLSLEAVRERRTVMRIRCCNSPH